MTEFNFDLALSLYESEDPFPVDFGGEGWQWLGYARKSNGKDMLVKHFEEGVDYSIRQVRETREDGTFSHYYEEIKTTVTCFKEMGMMAGTSKGKDVRKHFLRCEENLKHEMRKKANSFPLEFQNQVLAGFAELNSKIEAQNQKLLILAPVVEKFEKIEPALDFFEGLNPLLNEASAVIKNNPIQEFKILRQWIFEMELRPLGKGANIRMGKMLTPFYKICMGADYDFSNDNGAKKYPEAFKPLIKYCYQHILINK